MEEIKIQQQLSLVSRGPTGSFEESEANLVLEGLLAYCRAIPSSVAVTQILCDFIMSLIPQICHWQSFKIFSGKAGFLSIAVHTKK